MMVNSMYFQPIVFTLLIISTQHVVGLYNNDLTINWNSADFGNYINIAGKRMPTETNDKLVEDVLNISRSFLRDGVIGSLLRDFEDIQKDTGNLYHRKFSDESRKTNVFTAEKQTGSPYEVSYTCLNDTKQVILDILAKKAYAIGMLDADTKIPSGILQGHWLWLGSYDECKSVQSPSLPSGHQISGQYCLTSTMKYLPVMGYKPLTFGTCVPSSCSEDDVKALIHSLVDHRSGPPKNVLAVCDKEKSYSRGDQTALAVCGILGLLVCAGTLIDIYLRYTDDIGHKQDVNRQKNGRVIQTNERTGLLSSTSVSIEENPLIHPDIKRWSMLTSIMTSFSFVRNTEKLLSTTTASSPLSSLNGMRVLSMWWVILGHTFELPISYVVLRYQGFNCLNYWYNKSVEEENPLQAAKIGKRFTFQAILNGTFSVDTFFFMSGALVTYLCLKDISSNHGRTRWGMFYFHRVWRLTPAYAFCLMIFATLSKHFISGPYTAVYDAEMADQYDTCSSSWWSNLLYINNFYPDSGSLAKICMAWTWYLANDMQFFIISPIFIILLLRYRKAGITACVAMVIACVFIRLMTAIEYGIHLPNQAATKHTDDVYASNTTYNRPYTRIAPYMVGMLLGYLLYSSNCKARLNKISVMIGWSLAIVMGISPVYGLYHYYHYDNQVANLALSAFYISCSRLSWSLATAWVIYACATGYGEPVNKLLSWSLWAPLGRLTYCAYLVHPLIITVYSFSLPTPFFFGDIPMVYTYMGNLVSSYLFAYLVSMVIEAPMMGLEKVLLKR